MSPLGPEPLPTVSFGLQITDGADAELECYPSLKIGITMQSPTRGMLDYPSTGMIHLGNVSVVSLIISLGWTFNIPGQHLPSWFEI